MGVSNGAPYVFASNDKGIELEVAKAALSEHNLNFHYMSLARAFKEIEYHRIDIMAPISMISSDKVYFSDIHIYYQPIAFSLKKKSLKIQTLSDLKNYTVATFQGAKGYFGKDFLVLTQDMPYYHELPDMTKLIKLLRLERVDVVIFNFSIFSYYWKKAHYNIDELSFNDIFPLVPAYTVFKNELLRDEYNKGLHDIIANGHYRKIIELYLPQKTVGEIMQLLKVTHEIAKEDYGVLP